MPDFAGDRRRMVTQQLRSRDIIDERVLTAMGQVPRHEFVPPALRPLAYSDRPLPIENGQTISQPYIVALMLQAAALTPDATVLDIGTGSGYAAAVASQLVSRVISVERHPSLAETARQRLVTGGYDVEVITGDGLLGWPDAAPYDAIVAAATGPRVPQAWLEQLVVGGRLVLPIGTPGGMQRLVVGTRTADGHLDEQDLGDVTFVPLIGEGGWDEQGTGAGHPPLEEI